MEEKGNIFSVQRNNIYAGRVINTTDNTSYRKILFTINGDNLSDDILYNSPNHYEVEGRESLVDSDSNILITDLVELEGLLKCLGFKEVLTEEDIKRFYNSLLKNNALDNNLVCVNRDNLPREIISKLKRLALLPKSPSKFEPNHQLIKTRIHIINL